MTKSEVISKIKELEIVIAEKHDEIAKLNLDFSDLSGEDKNLFTDEMLTVYEDLLIYFNNMLAAIEAMETTQNK